MYLPKLTVPKSKKIPGVLKIQSKKDAVSTHQTAGEGEVCLIGKPRHTLYVNSTTKEPLHGGTTSKITAAIKSHIVGLCQCGHSEGKTYDQAMKLCTCIGLVDEFAARHLGWFIYTSGNEDYVLACVKYLNEPKDHQIFILTKHMLPLVFPKNDKRSRHCHPIIDKAVNLAKRSWDPETSRFRWLPTYQSMVLAGMVPEEFQDTPNPPRFVVDSRHLLEKIKVEVKEMPTVVNTASEAEVAATTTTTGNPSKTADAKKKKMMNKNKNKNKSKNKKTQMDEVKNDTNEKQTEDPLLDHPTDTIHGAPTSLIHESAQISKLAPLKRGTKSLAEDGWINAPDALEYCREQTTSSLCDPASGGSSGKEEGGAEKEAEKESPQIIGQEMEEESKKNQNQTKEGEEEKKKKNQTKKPRKEKGVKGRMGSKGKKIYADAKKKANQRNRDLKRGLALAKQSQDHAQPIILEARNCGDDDGDADTDDGAETAEEEQIVEKDIISTNRKRSREGDKEQTEEKASGETEKPDKVPAKRQKVVAPSELTQNPPAPSTTSKGSKRKRDTTASDASSSTTKKPSPVETDGNGLAKAVHPKKKAKKAQTSEGNGELEDELSKECLDLVRQIREQSKAFWISTSAAEKDSILGPESPNVKNLLSELVPCDPQRFTDPILELLSTSEENDRDGMDRIIVKGLGGNTEILRTFLSVVCELGTKTLRTETELMKLLQGGLKRAFGGDYASKCLSVWLFMGMHIYRPSPMMARSPMSQMHDETKATTSGAGDDDDDDDIFEGLMSELCDEEEQSGDEGSTREVKEEEHPVKDLSPSAATSLICGMMMSKGKKQPVTKIYGAIRSKFLDSIEINASKRFEENKDDRREAASRFLEDCWDQTGKTFGECRVDCHPKKPAEKEQRNIVPAILMLCWIVMKPKGL